MKKIIVLLFGFLLFSVSLKSQEKIKLFYNLNWEVTNEDNGYYYRDAEYNLNDFKIDGTVKDYSVKGNLLMEGVYREGKKYGRFVFYYDNGKIKSEGKYKKNRRDGYWKYYYRNGKLKQIVLFNTGKTFSDFSVAEYYDRDGNQRIKNGTGKWVNDSVYTGMFDTKSLKKLTGQFKDSLKHGVWKLVRISDNKLMHTERFRKGKFIEGTIYNSQFDYYGTVTREIIRKLPDENLARLWQMEEFKLDTTVFPGALLYADVETIFKTITGKEYKIRNRNAGYIYGDYSLFRFLASNIRYPMNAIENKISGKVYVGVVVDAQGNTKSISLIKGVQTDLDKEALRVVGLIDKWLPAISDGKEVESVITIPVRFTLE